jgi:O-antigen/teichoic acid export membrane protein
MLVKNIYIRLGANILNAAIGFIPFIFIIRVFGREVVGSIAYCCGLAGLFSLFGDLGLSTTYNKFLASEDNPRDISVFLFLKSILLIIYTLIFFSAYFLKLRYYDLDNGLLLIGFGVIFSDLVSQLFSSTFVGKRDFLFLSRVEIAGSVFLCVYNIIVCFLFPNKYLLAANMIIFRMIIILGGMLYFYKRNLLRLPRPRWQDVKRHLDYSLPIAFSSIIGRLTSYIDKVLLGRFVGMNELGLYEIASRCYNALDKLIKPVTSTLFTEIVHRIANTPSFFREKFRDIIHTLSFFGSTLALILIFASSPVVICFFGAENLRSAFILKFFALVIMAKLIWRPYEHVIYAIEKHKLILYLSPLNMVIRMAGYYFLIPLTILDIPVGAIALPITEFIVWFFPAGLVWASILKKEYGTIYILETFLKIWLPTAILIAISYFFNYSLFVFAIIYVLFLMIEYYLGVLTKNRWNSLIEPIRSVYSNL